MSTWIKRRGRVSRTVTNTPPWAPLGVRLAEALEKSGGSLLGGFEGLRISRFISEHSTVLHDTSKPWVGHSLVMDGFRFLPTPRCWRAWLNESPNIHPYAHSFVVTVAEALARTEDEARMVIDNVREMLEIQRQEP